MSMSKKEKADAVYKMLNRLTNIPEKSKSSKSSGSSRSSGSAKEKKKSKLLLSHLPSDSIKLITDYYQSLLEYKLVEWYPINNLRKDFVSANLNAIDFLSLPENERYINWYILSENPNAVDFLDKNEKNIKYHYLSCNKSSNPKLIKLLNEYIEKNPRSKEINKEELSKNKYAIDILTLPKNYYYINWKGLSSNPSPKAIKFLTLDENIENINWFEFSRNPCDNAIQFLIDNPNYIDWSGLSGNTNSKAIPLITKRVKEEKKIEKLSEKEYSKLKNKVCWNALSANINAIKLIIKKIKDGTRLDDIDWWALSKNPSIFNTYKNNIGAKIKIVERILSSNISSKSQTRVTDLPKDLHEKITKELLSISKNELREGIPFDKLNLNILCENPNAIDLLRERMIFEKNLSKDEYNRLPSKINWGNLCRNPKAIELLSLEENYNNLNWSELSKNPKAIDLLEKRVKYLSLNPQIVNTLRLHERISWNELSANLAIFVPM